MIKRQNVQHLYYYNSINLFNILFLKYFLSSKKKPEFVKNKILFDI